MKRSDRRELGWLTAGLLSFLLSTPAWALDLDQSIASQEQGAAHIIKTIGHGKKPNQHTSRKTKKKVYVMLFKAHPHKKT